MSGIITQKRIAKAFKDLMETQAIQQISVRQIMDEAGIRRQTFYDYFLDKYELTKWIYKQEFKENIQDYIGYDPIEKILERFIIYLKDNKNFYRNALTYHDQNAFEEVLLKQLESFTYEVIKLNTNNKKSVDDYRTLSKYTAYSLTGIIRDWINDDCRQEVDDLVSEINFVLSHFNI